MFTVPVEADDILVLASDGLSDNLWDEDILDEVVRFKRRFMPGGSFAFNPTTTTTTPIPTGGGVGAGTKKESLLGRRTLAGMLSEALCSRARAVSERRGVRRGGVGVGVGADAGVSGGAGAGAGAAAATPKVEVEDEEDEVPFARRAREQGKVFKGGKLDGEFFVCFLRSMIYFLDVVDISVLIAVVSPVENSRVE